MKVVNAPVIARTVMAINSQYRGASGATPRAPALSSGSRVGRVAATITMAARPQALSAAKAPRQPIC